MANEGYEEHPPLDKRPVREWRQFLFPESRMRVATQRLPRDWFDLLTRIPIIEQIVIKRFVENLMCDRWLEEPHAVLQGMSPAVASQDATGRALLQRLLTRMESNREKTPRELRKIRKRLGM